MAYASDEDSRRFIALVKSLAGADGGPADGRSQSVAARKLDLSAAYVGRVCRGEIARVRSGTIVAAMAALGHYNKVRQFAEAGAHFKHAADAGRVPVEPPEHPAKPHARWALDLYRECQRDAEADPWHEPGGAERRFIARLREYAGAE